MAKNQIIEISIHKNAATYGVVRPEFISTTLDWWHQKSEAWGNSSVINADLTHPNLIAAARGLSPFFLRIGGSFADIATYDMNNNDSGDDRFTNACRRNRQICLTRQRWDEVLHFANETGAKIFFTLAYLQHTRDESGKNDQQDWDSTNAEQLIQYTAQSRYANTVFGYELGNELTHKNKIQNITRLKNAYKELRRVIDETWSVTNGNNDNKHKPKILGPASIGPSQTTKLIKTLRNHIDIATYHKYHGGGKDPNMVQYAKGKSIVQHPINYDQLSKAVNKYMDNPEVWIGEGAFAFNSGRQNITDSFVGSFWYANLLGALSKVRHHTVYCRQALVGGYYELISHETMKARPDYWLAYSWKKLVGTKAIGPIISPSRKDVPDKYTFGCCKHPGSDALLIHAFCSKEYHSNPIFVITNIDKTAPFKLNITVGTHVTKYILTGKGGRRDSRKVLLNDNQLLTIDNGQLPELVGNTTDDMMVTLPPVSIAFVVVHGFIVDECVPQVDVADTRDVVAIKHSAIPANYQSRIVPFASETEMDHDSIVRTFNHVAIAQLCTLLAFVFIFWWKRLHKSR